MESLLALAGGMILPLYVVYFRHWDIGLFEIAVLAAVFEASIIVFELPTGIFADRFGRKLSTIIGFMVFALSGFIFFQFTTFIGFLIAEILFGLAETFISGALEALAVESLTNKSDQPKMFANRAAFRTGAMLAGMIATYLFAGDWLKDLFVPIIIIYLAGFLVSIFLIEKRAQTETGKNKPEKSRAIAGTILKNRHIAGLFAVGLLLNFVYEGPDQYWQVLLSEIKSISPEWFGFLTGAGLLVVTICVRFTKKLYRRFTGYLAVSMIVIAGSLFMVSYLESYPVLFGIIVFFAAKEFIRPALSDSLNRRFKGTNRATYLSLFNLTCSIGEVAAGIIAGWIASSYTISILFLVSLITALLVPVAYYLINGQEVNEI